jgi:alpha-L-arabinofuranosidase
MIEHVVLSSKDPMTANTKDTPLAVVPCALSGGSVDRETVDVRLPPFFWNMLRLRTMG